MYKHEDAAIAAAVLDGDVDRYAELIDKYHDAVFAIVARRVPSEKVQAVAHDVFVRAFQSLSNYGGAVAFGNWASRIAIRVCCDYWRDELRHQHVSMEAPPDVDQRQWLENLAGSQDSDDADSIIHREETGKVLVWVLQRLSPEDRTLVESIYFEDRQLKEVAAALGWSLVKTKVRAMRARRKMRQLLQNLGEPLS